MDIQDVQFVGNSCGQHGPYTFYKAFRFSKNGQNRILTLSEFFFVKMYRDSDLLCIGELQLLWFDKNNENMLASLRLYFLPENTPEGRMAEHGEDEILAISEKVVIRLDDLVTWITVDADWSFGQLAKCEDDMVVEPQIVRWDKHQEKLIAMPVNPEDLAQPKKSVGYCFGLTPTLLDFGDVEVERQKTENLPADSPGAHVIILSFPKYCRYRAVMKRLEGVENQYLKLKILNTLGGFYVKYPNTRVLFCKDTFEYPDIEGHELLCNHLTPKLKGRPRGRRKKTSQTRATSPGSESNESESSVITNHFGSVITRPVRVLEKSLDKRSDSPKGTRRSTRTIENNENKKFMKTLTAFMKLKQLPMGRVPSLGYKELNLHEFFTKVQKLGGYDYVTKSRLWKSIFEEITGLANSTSAATIVRRHYERFLLSYERHTKGEDHKPLPVSERKRLKKELKRKKGKQQNSKKTNSANNNGENATLGDIKTLFTAKKHHAVAIGTNNKDQINPAKPTSLRHIRVKPERQKDKQLVRQLSAEFEIKPNMISNSEVKTEPTEIKLEPVQPVVNNDLKEESKVTILDDASPKLEEPQVKSPSNQETNVKLEETSPKPEPLNGDSIKAETKIEPIEKDTEPNTSAVAPVVQIPEQSTSPIEGKENILLAKTGEATLPENESKQEEISDSKSPELQLPKVDSSYIKTENNFKKVKLDILRDQGLEVTPIRALAGVSIPVDIRPSVIQNPVMKSLMPPPGLPKKINVSITPATPIKSGRNTVKFPTSPVKNFMNGTGSTPPKVVQSKSIYSTDTLTWYGNPKEIFPQPVMAPRLPTPVVPRLTGGNPMAIDLSVTSPVKPILEISPVPQSSNSSQSMPSRISVAKNLYRSDTNPLLEGRRLSSNLEITLVGPRNSQTIKPAVSSGQKRHSSDSYAHKLAKLKMSEPPSLVSVPRFPKRTDLSITGGTSSRHLPASSSSSTKSDVRLNPKVQNSKLTKPLTGSSLPPYAESASNGATASLPSSNIPLMPPSLGLDSIYAYQAAMQSLYSNLPNMSSLQPPVLPIPTPDQLKFYAELMAQSRMGFNPFLPQNGVNNGGKNP